MSKLIVDYAQDEFTARLEIFSECTTVVVGILNHITKIRLF